MMRAAILIFLSVLLAAITSARGAGEQARAGLVLHRQTRGSLIYTTPLPPYPYQALAGQEQGAGSVKVTFDISGKAEKVVMLKSTGSKILDGNTVNFVLHNWKSSGGQRIAIIRPVLYLLR